MHVIAVRMKIKPEHVADFEAAMRRHVEATGRTEPGCVEFSVAKDKEDPTTYHLFEVYRDDAALAAHQASPTLLGLREQFRGWVEDRTFHNATLWERHAA